jgi:hypothetical protein
MSDSHKSRHGMHCKHWKDGILVSRHQVEANTKRKRRTNRTLRRTGKQSHKRGAWNFHKQVVPSTKEES